MITQYNSYGTIPADVQAVVANKISVLDRYMLMQTGEGEYTGLIYDPVLKKTEQIVFTRTGNYGSTYTVDISAGEYDYSVSNEYYVFSNEGIGKALNIPAYEGMQAHGMSFLVCLVAFGVFFKGVLFKCLKRR